MKKTIIDNEYNLINFNMINKRISNKDFVMQSNTNKKALNNPQNMKVIINFPNSSEDNNYVIEEITSVLLDIFEKNIQKQYINNINPNKIYKGELLWPTIQQIQTKKLYEFYFV